MLVHADIISLTNDMSRFAFIIRVMGLADLAQKYEAVAEKLRADRSVEAVDAARVWVSGSFGQGSGSLSDRYVYRDGSFDKSLNEEYEKILHKLTDFGHGV